MAKQPTVDIIALEIRAEVRQIKTMADGTVSVTLNLPEECRPQAKALMDWQGLEVKAVIVHEQTKKQSKRNESLG